MAKKQSSPKNEHEKKLPKIYNRKSTSKNKPTFQHIYHHFFSALVNNRSTPPTVLKSDLHNAVARWAQDGEGYLEYVDNKRGVSRDYILQELVLFRQYLTPVTLGIAIHDIFLLEDHDTNIITKHIIKKRVAYTLYPKNIKAFLTKRGHYNNRYEHPSSHRLLPQIQTSDSAHPYDVLFFQFFQSILDSRADEEQPRLNVRKISGSKLLLQMRQFVFSKQSGISSDSGDKYTAFHTTFQNIRNDLNFTMFGNNMNRLLISPGVAIKKLTNAGTVYTINLEKLSQHVLEHTSEE